MTSEFPVKRKDLWNSLGNIRKNDWLKAGEMLGLVLTIPTGGTSHVAIRKPSVPIEDIRGLVVTVYEGMSKQVNGIVFREFLKAGFEEDQMWRVLGKLK